MSTFSQTFGKCLVQQGALLKHVLSIVIDGTEYLLTINIDEQEYYLSF